MPAPYSVVIIRTRQIVATGLTLGEAKAQSQKWNRGATVEDCSTWEPAPAGFRFREPDYCEESEDRDRERDRD